MPAVAPKRNYDQSMGLWINEPSLLAPERIDNSIRTLAAEGYTIVRLFLRHTNFTHRSPLYIQAVARAVKLAHELGMRAVLDCEPHTEPLGRDMGTVFPDAMGTVLTKLTTRVIDGRAVLYTDPPAILKQGIFNGIEAAFCKVNGEWRKVEVEYDLMRETHAWRDGFIHREQPYIEGTPIRFTHQYTLKCRLPEYAENDLLVYARYAVRDLVDFWAPEFREYCCQLLDCYRGIPLDGVGWDEPAATMAFPYYRFGPAFRRVFRETCGYDLADKLYLIDAPGAAPESVKVRLDYYRTLNEGLAQSQAALLDKARTLFGDDIISGTHHCWQGEGGINDYRSGAVDYFRLADNMDAGYTDCSWWDPASVSYAYVLASSLGRTSPTGEAVANTWHFKPTVLNSRRNISFMTLLNITWFNIWFGGDCDCILQEGHYTWPETVAGMKRHQSLQRRIGKRAPVCPVAIWHGWEGVCAWNTEKIANAHKSFCLNTAHQLTRNNIAADFIDSRLLAESHVEGKTLVNRLGSYQILVLPYAIAIPRAAWEKVKAFAAAGGEVVFTGTPVHCDIDGGALDNEFARLLEVPQMSIEHYLAGIDAICTLPEYRAQSLEVCRPLPESWPRLLRSCEGEPHGVHNAAGNVTFLSDLDPQERLVEFLRARVKTDAQSFGANLLWRQYGTGDDSLLVIATADGLPVRGMIRWQGGLLEITGGMGGIITRSAGTLRAEGDVSIVTNK